MPRDRVLGATCAAAAIAALGSSFPAARALADYPVGSGQALRYGAAAVLLVLVGVRLPRLDLRRAALLIALAAIGLAGFNAFLIAAVREADPASVGVVIGCLPIVLALRRPKARLLGAALLAAGGAAAVQWTGDSLATRSLLFALAALACEAAFTLIALPLLSELGPAVVATYACFLAVPILLVGQTAAAPTDLWRLPTIREGVALAYLAVIVTAAGFLLWYTAVDLIGVERAGLFTSLLPVSALASSVVVDGSPVSSPRILGAVAVTAAIVAGLRTADQPPESVTVRYRPTA